MNWKPRKGVVLKPQASEPPVSPQSPLAKRSQAARLNAMERERQADVKAVALAQPHRRGDDSPEQGSALGRLCKREKWRTECFTAGELYGSKVRGARRAEGLTVTGSYASVFAAGEEMSETDREELIMARERADDVIRRLDPRAPSLMERLCYDDDDIPLVRSALAGDCLVLLAAHFGLLKTRHEEAVYAQSAA